MCSAETWVREARYLLGPLHTNESDHTRKGVKVSEMGAWCQPSDGHRQEEAHTP